MLFQFFSVLHFLLAPSAQVEKDFERFLSSEEAQAEIQPVRFDSLLFDSCLFHTTNEIRYQKGKSTFKFNKELYCAAEGHAQEMTRYNHFSHTGRNGSSSFDRIKDCDGNFSTTAENIAKFYPFDMDYKRSYYPVWKPSWYEYRYTGSKELIPLTTYANFARMVVEAWYNSKGHRQNLMDEAYTHVACVGRISPNAMRTEGLPSVMLVQNFGEK